MKIKIRIYIFLMLFFFSCNSSQGNIQNKLNEDEVSILNAIINHFNISGSNNKIYMINILFVDNFFEETCRCFDDDLVGFEHSYESMVKDTNYYITKLEINSEIIESFINNNIEKRRIENNTKINSEIFSNEDLLDDSYTKLIFSNAGFNKNETEALIHFSIYLPSYSTNASYAKYVYLIKDNGIWNVKKDSYSWIGP